MSLIFFVDPRQGSVVIRITTQRAEEGFMMPMPTGLYSIILDGLLSLVWILLWGHFLNLDVLSSNILGFYPFNKPNLRTPIKPEFTCLSLNHKIAPSICSFYRL